MTLTPQQVANFRAQAGLSATPPPPSSSDTENILAQRKQALGIDQPPAPEKSNPVSQFYGGKNPPESVGTDILNTIKSTTKDSSRALSDSASGKENSVLAGADIAKNTSEALVSPVTALAKPILNPVIKFLSDKYSSIEDKLDPKALQALNDVMDKHPVITQALGDLTSTAGNMMGVEGMSKIPSADTPVSEIPENVANTVKQGIDTAKNVVSNAKENISNAVNKNPTPQELESSAIKDATPAYNKSIVGEPAIRNSDGTLTPRVNEAKGLNTRSVNSTLSEIESGKQLAKIEGYDPKATSLEKAQLTDNEIAKKGKALDASLENEKVLRPPKELNKIIRDAVTDAADRSQLLSKSDPVVKNYIRSSQRIVDASDGTLAGERKVVLKLDQAYEDAGGKYSNNKPLDQIHRAARQALIEDMELKAQNTEVKASLREMQNLYKANETLWDKAKAEGGSVLEQLAKKHPVVTKIVKKGMNMVGLGETVNIIDH